MSGNNTCVTVLSCADSPLSTTGSIIGIVTLAYAVFITIVFQVKERIAVDAEIDKLIDRLRGESKSLERIQELVLIGSKDRIPESVRCSLRFTLQEAVDIIRDSASPPLLAEAADCAWLPWSLRRLFRRNYFLQQRDKVNSDLQTVIEIRVQVEGICSSALNRLVNFMFHATIILGLGSCFDVSGLVIEEIERQNAKISQLQDTLRTQNSMLEQMLGAVCVAVPGIHDECDRCSTF